jgi:diacylglycerol kinase (ATP)
MGKPGATGIRRIWNAFFYSLTGIRLAWQHESAFRQESALAIIMLPVAFWLGSNVIEYALLIGCVFIVLITELLNSAIEAIVDRVGTDHHQLSGQSKEMASAAVLFSVLLTVIVWGMVAWQKFGMAL